MQKTINTRDLQRDIKKVTKYVQNGNSLIVLKNAKPIFSIEPIQKKKNHKEILEKLKNIQFQEDEILSDEEK